MFEGKFSAEDRQDIKEAIQKVFGDIEKDTESYNYYSARNLCKELMKKFTKTHDGSGAIFTLNQDVFIETHCHDANIQCIYPYVAQMFVPNQPYKIDNISIKTKISKYERYVAKHNGDLYLSYFKLHGSINWRLESNDSLLITGGNKLAYINKHPILEEYQNQFAAFLNKPNTKLLIVGYGFQDMHINNLLQKASSDA